MPSTERVALPLRIPTESMVATPVHAIGYPGIADNVLVDPTTKWGLNDSSVDSGNISRLGTTSGTGRTTVQLDFTIRHGNSGGPLVNDMGQVLGITSMGISSSEEAVDYAINIQEAVSMLRKEGIDFTLIPYSPPVSPPPSISSEDDINININNKNAFPVIPVVIGVGVVIVIAAVAAVLIFKKPKPPVPLPVNKRPALLCLAPQHNGMMMSLENRQVVAGRRGCDVVFQEGTPGVSNRHCNIYWDNNSRDFVVTDLQSSFGTYMQNGQRLAPNVATHLKPGESF